MPDRSLPSALVLRVPFSGGLQLTDAMTGKVWVEGRRYQCFMEPEHGTFMRALTDRYNAVPILVRALRRAQAALLAVREDRHIDQEVLTQRCDDAAYKLDAALAEARVYGDNFKESADAAQPR
ncbi:MAG: hypothetical protein FJ279_02160 [Planctomycetes bacterium]|nr:hypothetical protein [Planctomycetota bacterium]